MIYKAKQLHNRYQKVHTFFKKLGGGQFFGGWKKLHCKGEPYHFSGERHPSPQTKKLTTLYW